MQRKRVLAAAGKLVPYLSERDVVIRRVSRDDKGKPRSTALFIATEGIWDNGIKAFIKRGPVSVPLTDYYLRRLAEGSLIEVKDEKQTRGSRESAGGDR